MTDHIKWGDRLFELIPVMHEAGQEFFLNVLYVYSKWPVTQGDYLKASLTTSQSTATIQQKPLQDVSYKPMSMKLGHNFTWFPSEEWNVWWRTKRILLYIIYKRNQQLFWSSNVYFYKINSPYILLISELKVVSQIVFSLQICKLTQSIFEYKTLIMSAMKIFKAHEKIDDIVRRNRNIIFTVV